MLSSWGSETRAFGVRNRCPGEYDTVFYFYVWIVIPVYFSFRDCVHVIELNKVKEGERWDRLRRFAQLAGISDPSKPFLLQLKPLRHLKRLVFYHHALWVLLLFPIGASYATHAFLQQPQLFLPRDRIILGGLWVGAGVFFLALAAHLLARRPRPTQARLRGVVARVLGPFSDPDEWSTGLVLKVAPALGLPGSDPEGWIEEAEQRLKRGNYEEALVIARMALALEDGAGEGHLSQRAEDLTEHCLLRLEGPA